MWLMSNTASTRSERDLKHSFGASQTSKGIQAMAECRQFYSTLSACGGIWYVRYNPPVDIVHAGKCSGAIRDPK